MRLRNLSAILGISVGCFCANPLCAGIIGGQTYIYVADDDSTSNAITYTSTSGGVASTLESLPSTEDPHQIAISGQYLFVANDANLGTVSEFLTNGASTSNSISIGGTTNQLVALAVSGSDLFVGNYTTGAISEYTINSITGALTVVSSFSITDPGGAGVDALAVSGTELYVTNSASGDIYGYNIASTPTLSFTTADSGAAGLTVYNGNLFVASNSRGVIGEYDATTGDADAASFITDTNSPEYLTVYNSELLVTNHTNGTVGEYGLTGSSGNTTLGSSDASFITGLTAPFGIAVGVAAAPLPSSAATLPALLGVVGIAGCWRSAKRRQSAGA